MKRTNFKTEISAVRIITAAALSADPSEALPKRLKILSWGDNPNANGRKVVVGEKFMAALSSSLYPFKKIPIDFEHNTCPGTPAYKESAEPRLVAGYATVECVAGDGVYLNVTRWTPEGRATASSFEDLSACPIPNKDGDVIALVSCALCRTGSVPGIEFVESPLSTWPELSAVISHNPDQPENQEKENQMDYKKFLIGLLKLSDTATDAEIDAAIKAMNSAEATPEPMNAEAVRIATAAQVAPLQASLADMARQNILMVARLDGKVVGLAADALKKFTPVELQAHVDALPVSVPLHAITPTHVTEAGVEVPLSADQRAIAINCGMDPDAVFKPKK